MFSIRTEIKLYNSNYLPHTSTSYYMDDCIFIIIYTIRNRDFK